MLALALLLSFICTTLVHGYLLYVKGNSRKTVSHSAADSTRNHFIYITGHTLSGLFALYFAYEFFYVQNSSSFLLGVMVAAVVFEWTQAVVPARGKYEVYHTTLASLMGLGILIMALTVPFIVNTSGAVLTTIGGIWLVVALMSMLLIRRSVDNFWKLQMMFFTAFYIEMLIVI